MVFSYVNVSTYKNTVFDLLNRLVKNFDKYNAHPCKNEQ